MHNMQDIWSVRFTCLLVCRSAIFIDSKRGGKQSFPKAEGTCAVRVNIGAGEGALREAGEGQIP